MAQNQSLAQALPAAEQVSTDTETMAEAQKGELRKTLNYYIEDFYLKKSLQCVCCVHISYIVLAMILSDVLR